MCSRNVQQCSVNGASACARACDLSVQLPRPRMPAPSVSVSSQGVRLLSVCRSWSPELKRHGRGTEGGVFPSRRRTFSEPESGSSSGPQRNSSSSASSTADAAGEEASVCAAAQGGRRSCSHVMLAPQEEGRFLTPLPPLISLFFTQMLLVELN